MSQAACVSDSNGGFESERGGGRSTGTWLSRRNGPFGYEAPNDKPAEAGSGVCVGWPRLADSVLHMSSLWVAPLGQFTSFTWLG